MSQARHFTLLILVFVSFLLMLGTIGYRSLEPHWSLSEAFYMTVITVSTVGFAEIQPLSPQGRWFTVVLIFLGLFAISVIGAHAARLLIDSEIKNVLGRKRMKKEISSLKDHYVVCGYGRIGSMICAELQEAGVLFAVVEKDDALVEQAEKGGCLVLRGDATNDSVLHEVGIERAQGVVAALNSDAHNLFISLAAREINAGIKIIARGEEVGSENRMLRAGANVVVSPLKLGGRQIARMIVDDQRPNSPTSPYESTDLVLQQICPGDDLALTVDELMRQAHGLLAVAVERSDGRTEMRPDGNTRLESQDTLFFCRGTE